MDRKQESRFDVSIIVVNWNTRELLRECLESVIEETKRIRYELIVIDNASSDGSCNMVRDNFPNVLLIANTTNKGYAAALNQGMRIAKGKYFLILNSDIIICDKAVQRTVAYAEEHPTVAVVGCQVWQDRDNVQMTCFRFPSILNLFLNTFALNKIFRNNRFFGREWMLWWRRDSERQVDVISGMFMLVRRKAIDQVGLMDESFFLYFEETDWCYRFSKAGWKVVFWPGAKIVHVHGGSASSSKDALRAFVEYHKSLLTYFKKHRGLTCYFVVRVMLLCSSLIRFVIWFTTAGFKKLTGGDSSKPWSGAKKYFGLCRFLALGLDTTDCKWRSTGFFRGHLKSTMEFISACLYTVFLPLMSRSPRRVVIYYHGIEEKDLRQFGKQMKYVAKHCHVVKPSEIAVAAANEHNVIASITFDDGLSSFCNKALPVLQRYSLTAAVFVPAENLGMPILWKMPDDSQQKRESVMTEKQVAELDREGFEVFSHTLTHRPLTELEEHELEDELVGSKNALEKIVGHEIIGISYPYGAYNNKVCEAARKAGYKLGFTIEPNMVNGTTDKLEIGRFSVSPRDSLIKFKLKIIGAYQGVRYLRTFKASIMGRQ